MRWPAMDDLDRRILQLLREDSRATNESIGAHVGLTESAVRHRVRALRADGTLLKFTVITRPLGPEGLVLIRCQPGRTSEVVERVRDLASDLFESSGAYDLGATLEAESMEGLNRALDRLRAIPGVQETVTLVRLTRFVRTGAPPGGRVVRRRPSRTGHRPRRAARSPDRSRRTAG